MVPYTVKKSSCHLPTTLPWFQEHWGYPRGKWTNRKCTTMLQRNLKSLELLISNTLSIISSYMQYLWFCLNIYNVYHSLVSFLFFGKPTGTHWMFLIY